MADVEVNIAGLKQFGQAIEKGMAGTADNPLRRAFRQWAARYRGFSQERFVDHSRGGGNWPKLAFSTVMARRAGKGASKKTRGQQWDSYRRSLARMRKTRVKWAGKGDAEKVAGVNAKMRAVNKKMEGLISNVAILRDTSTLFLALTPTFSSKSGQLEEHIPYGVRVGYGGPHRHPGGSATTADIASFHQEGAGNLPVRRIIVPPSPQVVAAMGRDMEKAVAKMTADANRAVKDT